MIDFDWKVLQQIERKGIADKHDLDKLSYLGLPIHSCLPKRKSKENYWIGFKKLEDSFEDFANLPRFSKLREEFEKKIKYNEAKDKFFNEMSFIEKILKKVEKILKKVKIIIYK